MFRAAVLTAALSLALHVEAADRHPDVGGDPGVSCEECHAEATPRVTSEWQEGKHGLLLVRCLVCHGSRGADFVVRPAAGRCEGCHPAEAAPVPPAKGKRKAAPPPDCFACHAPHGLAAAQGAANPHAAR